MTLTHIHMELYWHFLTIYVCPDDMPEQWFIIPNPAFNGAVRLNEDGSVLKRYPYRFKILADGRTPQPAKGEKTA